MNLCTPRLLQILPYFEYLDPDYHQAYCFAHEAYGAISAAEREVNLALERKEQGTSKTTRARDSTILTSHMFNAFPYLKKFESGNLVRQFILVVIDLLEIEVDSFQIKRDKNIGKLKRMKRNLGMRSDPAEGREEDLWIVFDADIEQKVGQTSQLIVNLISHTSAKIRRVAYEALLDISLSERARNYEWCALHEIGYGDSCEDQKNTCVQCKFGSASMPISPASILHNIIFQRSRLVSELLTCGLHDAATCTVSTKCIPGSHFLTTPCGLNCFDLYNFAWSLCICCSK